MELASRWRADLGRESTTKEGYIKITVISIRNFTSSNVVLSYQYMEHFVTSIACDTIKKSQDNK
jgi:hypothetical protein